MNKNNFIQFIKDGLVGLAVAGLMYVPITLAMFFLSPTLSLGATSLYTGLHFMPPICLIMFMSVGINGRFIKSVTTHASWGKSILKMLSVSWLVALFVTLTQTGSLVTFIIVGGAITIPLAFVIAYLIAVEFNNPQGLHRLFIPVITSILAIVGIPVGWYLGLTIYTLIFGFG
ncbi:MAG: hypothetical protein WA821_07910 [Anaerolineales bacterium]